MPMSPAVPAIGRATAKIVYPPVRIADGSVATSFFPKKFQYGFAFGPPVAIYSAYESDSGLGLLPARAALPRVLNWLR